MTNAATSSETRRRATLIGAGAVFLWGSLAILTTLTGDIPPFQMVAIAFGVAFVIALTKWVVRGETVLHQFRHPGRAWSIGIIGLFGYHVLVFTALKSAPPVQANLINYLWPLLIVFFFGTASGREPPPAPCCRYAAGLRRRLSAGHGRCFCPPGSGISTRLCSRFCRRADVVHLQRCQQPPGRCAH